MAKKKAALKKKAPTKKLTAKGTKKKSGNSGSPKPPKVRVQMFRQGLGDSFLVTFDYQGANERRMLIDCGTLGNSVSKTKTANIADYLETLIGSGKKIDYLVATHEHQDHVSGFKKDLQPVLKGNVGQVWLSWAENPSDPLAQSIEKFKGDLGSALFQVSRVAPADMNCQIALDLLGFAGDVTLGAKFAETVHDAMEFIRTETNAKTVYHKPGELITDQIPGFRVYVLGPPRSEDCLKDLGSHRSDELYGLAAALKQTAAFHLAEESSDAGQPFDERFRQSGSRLREVQYSNYYDPQGSWRRIDYDWLSGISELALQLDNLTNNTSLVLAFERIADGKVLLFPADAQQGSWLSWHDPQMKWSVEHAPGKSRDVTTADLLARTVFYKVGHHSSHNATAKGKGLELMNQRDELVAFIPVDRGIALTRNPKDSWQMPARALYRELLKRCQGRVVRSDLGWAAPAKKGDLIEKELFGLGTEAEWTEWSKNQQAATHVSVTDPLFVDYLLK